MSVMSCEPGVRLHRLSREVGATFAPLRVTASREPTKQVLRYLCFIFSVARI